MKIASAQLQLASTHEAKQEHQVRESLNMWTGLRRVANREENSDAALPARQIPESTRVQLSELGRQNLNAEATASNSSDELRQQMENDPKLMMLRAAIEMLTGRKINIFDASDLQASGGGATTSASGSAGTSSEGARPAGYGVEYDYFESYAESETTTFSAQGSVLTQDGQEISFSLNLSMSRSYYEETSVSIRMGDARLKDPLVLNFNGSAAQLTDTRFHFDLDADGEMDSINFVKPGSGFLTLDRNQDGKVNDGRELFGAMSGDGYAELAALDEDGNGWIDENDSAYKDLRVWSKDAQGNDQLQTLQAANVGAISLAQMATPYSIKDHDNQLQGQIRSTSVFLQETGGAGTMQKIDLAV